MAHTLTLKIVRAVGWFLRKVWRQIFQGIHVEEQGIEKVATPFVQCSQLDPNCSHQGTNCVDSYTPQLFGFPAYILYLLWVRPSFASHRSWRRLFGGFFRQLDLQKFWSLFLETQLQGRHPVLGPLHRIRPAFGVWLVSSRVLHWREEI